MQYAIVNGLKVEAQSGMIGICPGCGKEVVAKCGAIKLHHWAHKHIKDCDTWWEPETGWHRNWKYLFPENFREIVFTDSKTLEVHRADIHTSEGVTIEFQNSPMSIQEMESRDSFYDKLIWVVNAQKFKGFKLTQTIPDPTSNILNDHDFSPSRRMVVFMRKNDLLTKAIMVQIFGFGHRDLPRMELDPNFWLFEWKHAHENWYKSKSHVFFDLGDEFLYRLRARRQVRDLFWYVQVVKKIDFIGKYSKGDVAK